MKIIDAHLHLFSNRTGWAEQAAQSVGHHNSIEHLTQVYDEIEIIHGIIMGNGKLAVERHKYPEERFHYCVGLDSSLLRSGENEIPDMIDQIREHLRRSSCCGVKLYPGYNKIALSDDLNKPIMSLNSSMLLHCSNSSLESLIEISPPMVILIFISSLHFV